MQQSNENQEAERLRTAVSNPNLSLEQRNEAARILAELEKPKTTTRAALREEVFRDIDKKVAQYRADQLERFKVCSACLLKQDKANTTCELCGASGEWESPLPASDERARYIAATTNYTPAELNYHVEHNSMDTAYAAHCARVLELRGVPRVMSFWEKAGFTLYGRPRA